MTLLAGAATAWAEDAASPAEKPGQTSNQGQAEAPPQSAGAEDATWVDSSQRAVTHTTGAIVSYVDYLFGGDYYEAEATSFLRWINTVSHDEDRGESFDTDLKAKVTLPGTEERLSILVSSTEDVLTGELQERGTVENPDQNVTEDDNVSLAYVAGEDDDTRLSVSADPGFLNNDLSASVRWRKQWDINPNIRRRFIQTGFWKEFEGFGTTSQLEFFRRYDEGDIGLWTTSATYSEDRPGVSWGSGLSFINNPAGARVTSFDLGVIGETRPNFEALQYRLGVRFRENIWRRWLFFEIEPELRWPVRTAADGGTQREQIAAIYFRLEVQFDYDREMANRRSLLTQ